MGSLPLRYWFPVACLITLAILTVSMRKVILMDDNERRLTEMYLKDTEELRKQIDELKQDRDLWMNRALEAEASHARAKRNMRRV